MKLLDPTQREIMAEQKAYLKDKPFKYKLQYFAQYYLLDVCIVLFFAAILVWIIVSIATHKDNACQIVVMNAAVHTGDEDMAREFEQYAGIDTKDYQVTVDTGYYINFEGNDNTTYTNIQKFVAVVMAQDAEIALGDQPTLDYYADSGFFKDLNEVLTKEEIEALGDSIIYHTYSDETDAEEFAGMTVPVGIKIEENPRLLSKQILIDQGIMVFIANTKRPEMARKFFDYLFETVDLTAPVSEPDKSLSGDTASSTTEPNDEEATQKEETPEPVLTESIQMKGNLSFSQINLSGNLQEKITTDTYGYVEGERFVLFIEPDITTSAGLAKTIDHVMDVIEESVGVKYPQNTAFATEFYDGAFKQTFGDGRENLINVDRQKIEIYCVKEAVTYSYPGVVILNAADVNPDTIDYGLGFTHELIHNLQYAAIGTSDFCTMEGIATYETSLIIPEVFGDDCKFDPEFNYDVSTTDMKITEDNAEDLYTTFSGEYWNDYVYGYHFFKYVCENVDKDFVAHYMEASKENPETYWENSYRAKSAEIIKNLTSENIFRDFGKYMSGK